MKATKLQNQLINDVPKGPTITVNIPLTNHHIRILREFRPKFWSIQPGEGELADVAKEIFDLALAFPDKTCALLNEFNETKEALNITTIAGEAEFKNKLLRKAKVRHPSELPQKGQDCNQFN